MFFIAKIAHQIPAKPQQKHFPTKNFKVNDTWYQKTPAKIPRESWQKHHWWRNRLHRGSKPKNSSNYPLTTAPFASTGLGLSNLKNPPMRMREKISQIPLGSLIWRDEKEREVQKPDHIKPTKDPPLQPWLQLGRRSGVALGKGEVGDRPRPHLKIRPHLKKF